MTKSVHTSYSSSFSHWSFLGQRGECLGDGIQMQTCSQSGYRGPSRALVLSQAPPVKAGSRYEAEGMNSNRIEGAKRTFSSQIFTPLCQRFSVSRVDDDCIGISLDFRRYQTNN